MEVCQGQVGTHVPWRRWSHLGGLLGGGQCAVSPMSPLVRSAEESNLLEGRETAEGWGPVSRKSRCVTSGAQMIFETTWPHESTKVYRVEGTELCGLSL